MNVRITLLATAIAACLPLTATAAGGDKFRTVARPIQGEYIVVLKDAPAPFAGKGALLPKRVEDEAKRLATSHRFAVEQVYSHALRGFSIRANDVALAKLLADPSVAYVEEDSPISEAAVTKQTNAPWGLDRIDQTALPLSTTFSYTRKGSGVHVYVLDNQVNTSHTEFTGRIGNGTNTSGDTSKCTTNSHGSNVAGIIGGSTYGVAKGVTIHPVQVLKCDGTSTASKIIAGIDWVIANVKKPAVANLSLGGGAATTLDTAVQKLIDAGVITVVAAANDNTDACTKSPARVPAAITVGATTSADARWSSSNYGKCLDLFAPGASIKSASNSSNTGTTTYSGTSQAAPHVAGAAAMYINLWAETQTTPASQDRVRTAIVNNATTGKVTGGGTGSPNVLLNTSKF
jgi:serine protease